MAQYEIKKCDITIECGATFTMYFVVRDNNNSLVDLTGSTVEAQLREYAEANDYFEFTATHNGSGGRVTLTMPFEDTAAIPYTSGVYDVYITDQNNDREKYLIGDVNIVPAVTKPVAGEIIYLLSFASEDDFPSYGMVRRLYFSHATNHMYRWNGTDYVDIVTDGEAATVEVGDVETLPAGSDATVENVGSLLNAVFDFGIPEGNGIASIEKTGTDVLTDTYTVTFTDPNVEAFDFDVTNGKGIVSIAEVVSGLTHTFTVTFNDGDTFTYTLTDGNGIVSVEKTGATDNVDHYRITFDDGTYFDYNVTNVDTSEFYDKDEVDALLADKADVGDSYTKDEEDALLADKADSADLGDLASKDTVDWDSDIDNIPSVFPPEGHNHDDRYYTETEMDSLLADKADADDVYTKDDVDDALAEKANTDDVYTKDETDEMLLAKAPVILSSASGSIASFTDGSPAPVTALSVGIEPVQDLHGYDNPWPAGGGKNILVGKTLSETVRAIDFSFTSDDVLTFSGTNSSASAMAYFNIYPNESGKRMPIKSGIYTFSSKTALPTGAQIILGFKNQDGTSISGLVLTNSRQSVSGTIAVDCEYSLYISVSASATVSYNGGLQLESGSSASSWTPCSNICPISGHTSATVTTTGKNLLDKSILTTSSSWQIVPLNIPSGVYTMSTDKPTSDTSKLFLYFRLTGSSTLSSANAVYLNHSVTLTIPDGSSAEVVFRCSEGTDKFSNYNYQLELGSSASACEVPSIQTVTIDLNGTRYGGTLNVLTGTMVVDRAIVTFDGTESASNFAISTTSDLRNRIAWNPYETIGKTNGTFLANILETGANSSGGVGNKEWQIWGGTTGPRMWISVPKSIASVNDFNAWLTSNNLQVVYELATPLTVQLTPSQIQTLKGQNSIWSDTGDVAVEYRADSKMYIDQQIAESQRATRSLIAGIETEMVASKNYAEGDLLIVGDSLYKTTATIASGATLTVGTNVAVTTVAEQLIALANA